MRIAHATDIHWQTPPSLREVITVKRALGSANLYLRGRRHEFQRTVQSALVDHLVALEPDLVLITGDLTATALHSEFALAKESLAPVLDTTPTLVIPGNHDVYTPGAKREFRMKGHFEQWMGLEDGPVARLDLDEVTVLGLDPNRPTFLQASGVIPEPQLIALESILADPDLADREVILVLHYPVLDRRGAVYDNTRHGLLNAVRLIEVLERAPKRPRMILHGHEHHGFNVPLTFDEGPSIEIFNCGSSGYAFVPEKKRAAAMNLYTLADGELGVERFLFDGQAFAPEPGGAYATGR